MPSSGPGIPCRVSELCSDGTDYRVTCDPTTALCMCMRMGISTGATPTVSCTGFDPLAALGACGFPAGKI